MLNITFFKLLEKSSNVILVFVWLFIISIISKFNLSLNFFLILTLFLILNLNQL